MRTSAITKSNIIYLTLVAQIILFATVWSSESHQPQLEVHNLFKPETCERKARATDVITVHYKGTLDNGKVFDSR